MNKEELNKEQRLLSQVRKTLSNVIKDVTPLAGNPNPLSNGTLEEIKYCFAIISGREKELADKIGLEPAKPRNTVGEQTGSELNFVKLSRLKS